jgi:hypothetical protein
MLELQDLQALQVKREQLDLLVAMAQLAQRACKEMLVRPEPQALVLLEQQAFKV